MQGLIKSLLFLLFLNLNFATSFAQSKYDYNWVIGHDTFTGDPVGNAILINFNLLTPTSKSIETVANFKSIGSNASISDKNGQLLFYTSGCQIINSMHQTMSNGDSINSPLAETYYCPYGYSPNPEGAIAIPWPDSQSLYLLFINDFISTNFPNDPLSYACPRHLNYQVVDSRKENGLGAVVLRDQIAIKDTMACASVEACRHANGRDWWVMTPKSRSNCYFTVLVTPQGVGKPSLQCTGLPWNKRDDSGQAFFTPDGKKFIRFNIPNGIFIYDFDNVTGALSNPISFSAQSLPFNDAIGGAISPNSRYLYIAISGKLFQYDLESEDISLSKTLVSVSDNVPDPYTPNYYSLSALGPDGKIYISSSGDNLSLSVVHRPDCPGLYSLPENRAFKLGGYNFFSVPNMPHYGYPAPSYTCDSILVNSNAPIDGNKDVSLYPNPVMERLTLYVNHPLEYPAQWNLYDAVGRLVRQVSWTQMEAENEISMIGLDAGMYYYSVLSAGVLIQSGKLAVVGRR
jgi:hypothetical protein